MKTLTLNGLIFKNFKGIQDLEIEFNGQDLSISGRNATCKTTIVDGIHWLLFGKDSHGKADFQLKPVYEDGTEKHNLDTVVSGSFGLNGEPKALMKRFREKYTKKRGTATKDFTGHTTDYFVDGVPVKQKEYQDTIDEIIDVSTFRIVTNPFEFNNIHWTDRRGILLDMCGGTSDQDKLKKNEQEKKKIQAKQKDINKEIEQIPIRIDELTASIKDVPAMDAKDKKRLEDEVHGLRNKLQGLSMGEAESKLRIRVNEIELDTRKLRDKMSDTLESQKKPIITKINDMMFEQQAFESKIKTFKNGIDGCMFRIRAYESEQARLREEWIKVDVEKMEDIEACPECGYLPQDRIDDFNTKKASELERIDKDGMSIGLKIDKENEIMQDEDKELAAAKTGLENAIKILAEKNEKLEALKKPVTNLLINKPEMAKLEDLEKEKTRIEKEIAALSQGNAPAIKVLEFNIEEKEAEIKKWNEGQAAFESAEKSRQRIKDLGENEKAMATEYEKLEKELSKIEKFIVDICKSIESSLNDKFKLVRFKLFEKQINEGINPICVITINGVPYNSANNAAKINGGLDIINTMAAYYKFRAPIFIDNKEAVNELLPIDTQVISLIVSKDEKLTFSE